MINQKKFALLFGCLIGGIHLLRSLGIAIIPGLFQRFIMWVMGMHFMQMPVMILPFNFWKMILLVVITFIIGMIVGTIISAIFNSAMKK
ncbi:MAG: hypothetical protein WC875_00025 [Candidatus Absconditabacterales bacterium]|jgi:hypothetical protein